jgi:hypothetical protein
MSRAAQVALATGYQADFTEAPVARTSVRDIDLSRAAELWPEATPIFEELQARRDRDGGIVITRRFHR